MFRMLCPVILFVLSQGMIRSQTVEMKIPDTRKLERGKLSVVFKDTVGEEEARRLIQQSGYTIAESKFKPVMLFAQADDSLSRAAVQRLSSHPQFLSMYQQDLRPFIEFGKKMIMAKDSAFWSAVKDTVALPRFTIVVAFKSNASESDLRKFVEPIRELKQPRISKSVNEMVVEVPPGAEETAMTRLRKSRLVEVVSYIVVPGTQGKR
jgi:hypothetical protein